MITIRIFGTTPPCAKCKRAEAEAHKAAERFPNQVQVLKLDALGPEAEPYGLMMTPTIVVDDEVVGRGTIVPSERLAAYIQDIIASAKKA